MEAESTVFRLDVAVWEPKKIEVEGSLLAELEAPEFPLHPKMTGNPHGATHLTGTSWVSKHVEENPLEVELFDPYRGRE
jgi:hypothetical protein